MLGLGIPVFKASAREREHSWDEVSRTSPVQRTRIPTYRSQRRKWYLFNASSCTVVKRATDWAGAVTAMNRPYYVSRDQEGQFSRSQLAKRPARAATGRRIRTILNVWHVRPTMAVVMIVLGACGPLAAWSPPAAGTPIEWGLYQIYWGGKTYGDRLDREIANLGSAPDYVLFFRDLSCPFPKAAMDQLHSRGATPVVSLELTHWHQRGGRFLGEIVRGTYDDHFRRWAADAKADGRRVLLRFGFEFNGNWVGWSGDPKAFRTAWRRVHGIFREAGADNVEWVWAPNHVSVPSIPDYEIHRYYPGHDVVDWVALDGYNWGEKHDQWHQWESFKSIFARQLDEFARRYPEKPVMISEFGCVPGEPGRKAEWIRQAYRAVLVRPSIKAVVWFNYDKRREGEHNWRLDSSPDALRAFNETFASPGR